MGGELSWSHLIFWLIEHSADLTVHLLQLLNTASIDWALLSGTYKRQPASFTFILSRLSLLACYLSLSVWTRPAFKESYLKQLTSFLSPAITAPSSCNRASPSIVRSYGLCWPSSKVRIDSLPFKTERHLIDDVYSL